MSATTSRAYQLLERATAVLPLTDEELIQKGVAAGVTERLLELGKVIDQMQQHYGTLSELEERIQDKGVPPDDHSLYADLLEWRAMLHEKSELIILHI